MPCPVKGLLEIYEDITEIILMLHVMLVEKLKVKYLLCSARSWFNSSLIFSNNLFSLILESVYEDLHNNLVRLSGSVELTQKQVSFLEKCDHQ